ncbi:hypothetical protein SLEP1_g9886 [Rubroshorea leprosula]|uniref:BED-type domain-containing protein n=1 Tax=Rubroshorea leprosula TaxID=152421 RepID=A0AAV5IG68_9ROSI|nr:hypothetical protein SLEP1_g9886 [Rubroshorea leprosula]
MNTSGSGNGTGDSIGSTPSKTDDPAWAHCLIIPGRRNQTKCLYCDKLILGGGITRLKEHLAGIKGNVGACKKVSADVKRQMQQLLSEKRKGKEKRQRLGDMVGSQSQKTIKNALQSREKQEASRMAIARWWYDANVPFRATRSKYYLLMWDAVTSMGPGIKGPSYHHLRGSLLKCAVKEVNEWLLSLKSIWSTNGCSIMADGWTNQRQQPIINFLVYCPRGSMFLKSVDTSGLTKDADTLERMFDEVVKEVGVENVVQFITDNDASFKAAGKRLEAKYSTFFWSPCAAHCIDLMLENFSDARYFPIVDTTIGKARKITKFIYNHSWVLALMRRDYTNGRHLCRPAVTRFATHFLSIQCLLKFKKELRQMFTSDAWVGSRYARNSVGKEVCEIVLEDREFWSNCILIVKINEPLVRVLRLVDNEEKPSMGYLYEAIDKAKETIKKNFNNRLSQYMPYIKVIDARWDKQLYSPLHSAGCFLNPGIYFRLGFNKQTAITRGLFNTLTTLIPDEEKQDLISSQLEEYKKATGTFRMSLAIRQREKLNPVAWWDQFGTNTPELQKFAIRVLSQCTNATGCERNWSAFDFVHSKKRNRLEHERLNALVFVRYNLKLRERIICRGKEAMDPLSLENIDILADWVAEEPALLDKDDYDVD